ncbi:MAG: DUF5063 domain-containing protein [Bacteroidales bacterium]|nr:DUF5063 domain-containing protein [Bacteroidales bacterium]
MKEINNEIVFPELEEFLFVGKEYCFFLEKISSREVHDVLDYVRKILPYLYIKASMIPFSELTDDDFIQRYVSEEDYEIVFNEVREKVQTLEPHYIYNPELKEPEKISIAEALTDIYQDIKDLLLAFNRGLTHEKISVEKYAHLWFIERIGTRIVQVLPAFHQWYVNTYQREV